MSVDTAVAEDERYIAYRPESGHAIARRKSRWRSAVLPAVLSLAIGFALWTFVALVIVADRPYLLPTPLAVITESLLQPDHLLPMLRALGTTTSVALIGLAVASLLGIAIAVAMSQSRVAEKLIYPYAVILQTIPVLALVPLIGMWFGYAYPSRAIVCVIIALFPMIANTLFGLQSVEPAMHDLFTIRRASARSRLFLLKFPAAMPSIFSGLRQSSGLAVIGAVVGDMYFTQGAPGIGTLLAVYTSRLQSADLFAAITLASLLGMVVFGIFTWLSRVVVGHWHATARQGLVD